MTLIKLVIDVKKIWAWSKAHWKWLVLVIGGVTLYALGRKSAKNLLIAAEAARDQYKKDKEAIERNAAKKSKANEKAIEQYHKTAELLKEKRDEEISEIDDKTTEDVLEDLGIEKL